MYHLLEGQQYSTIELLQVLLKIVSLLLLFGDQDSFILALLTIVSTFLYDI